MGAMANLLKRMDLRLYSVSFNSFAHVDYLRLKSVLYQVTHIILLVNITLKKWSRDKIQYSASLCAIFVSRPLFCELYFKYIRQTLGEATLPYISRCQRGITTCPKPLRATRWYNQILALLVCSYIHHLVADAWSAAIQSFLPSINTTSH